MFVPLVNIPVIQLLYQDQDQDENSEVQDLHLIQFFEAVKITLQAPDFQGDDQCKANLIRTWMRGEGKIVIEELQTLDIMCCQLTAIPPEIGLFRNLTFLDCEDNQLTDFPVEILLLSSLKKLYAADNQFNQFPKILLQVTTIEELFLYSNEIKTLPEEIGELINLQNLDLSNNQLEVLPAEIGKLKTLTLLNLKENNLEALPSEFSQLEALRFLDLSNNDFAHFPEQLESIPLLQILTFSENPITQVSLKAGTFQNLELLNLIGNQLTSFSTLGLLPHLNRLYLSLNPISYLDESIEYFPALRELYMSGTEITELPEQIGNLSSLSVLDLEENYLSTFPSPFWNLQKISSLNLSNNHFAMIPSEIENLRELEELNLEHNSLAQLPSTFRQLTSLTTLNLSHNNLTFVPPELESLVQIETLDISWNSIPEEIPDWLEPSKSLITDPSLEEELQVWTEEFNQTFSDARPPVQAKDHWSQECKKAFPSALEEAEEEMPPKDAESAELELFGKETELLSLVSREEHELLRTYLKRLRQVSDYSNPDTQETKNNIILRAHRMIQLAAINPEFKRKMMDLINEALTSCHDRVMIYFNQIEIQWHLDHKVLSDDEFKALATLASRYTVLQQCATQLVNKYKLSDEIEASLYLQMQFHKTLHLPITISTMAFPHHAHVSPEMFNEVKAEIMGYTPERLLAKSTLWLERMSEKYPKQAEEIDKRYGMTMVEAAKTYYDLDHAERDQWLEKQLDSELSEILQSNKSFLDACNAMQEQRAVAISQLDITVEVETKKRKRNVV